MLKLHILLFDIYFYPIVFPFSFAKNKHFLHLNKILFVEIKKGSLSISIFCDGVGAVVIHHSLYWHHTLLTTLFIHSIFSTNIEIR